MSKTMKISWAMLYVAVLILYIRYDIAESLKFKWLGHEVGEVHVAVVKSRRWNPQDR